MLLNPSDTEATFRAKADVNHIGYLGNITETVGKSSSIITGYAYEQNIYSDSQFLKDYLAEQNPRKEKSLLVVDGAYCGENNHRKALARQTKLVTTNFTGRKSNDILRSLRSVKTGNC